MPPSQERLHRNTTNLDVTITALKKFGFLPSSILDIGAHHGNWSKGMQRHFPKASFTLVEAIDYPELKKTSYEHHIAILDETERDVDWYEMRNTGDSMFKEVTGHFSKCAPVKKRTTTLDKLLKSRSFQMLKIDVQGAELNVLKGGHQLIQNVEVVLLEVPFCGSYNHGAPDFLSIINYMSSIGFRVFDITELHRFHLVTAQLDICFVRSTSPIFRNAQSVLEKLGA